MPIETEVKGRPASIEGAATWMSGTLATAVDGGTGAFTSSRSSALGDWDGDTGEAFVGAMGRARTQADDLYAEVTAVAGLFTTYAGVLRTAQESMSRIRGEATGGDLVVSAYVIQDPGPGPARPAESLPADVTPRQADAHSAAVDDYNAHQQKIVLFNRLGTEAPQVWDSLEAGAVTIEDKYRGLSSANWAFNAGTIMAGFGGAAMEVNASVLRATAVTFGDEAAENLARLRANPGAAGLSTLYDDLDFYGRAAQGADDLVRSADDLARRSVSTPIKVGGALAALGVVYDISQGKDPVQAVTSGGVGFGASVLAGMGTGALIGTAIPIPGVGTAIGAVVGAGVGIFASGAVDSLFENGPDVGAALESGKGAVTDTVGAIDDGIGAIGDGIGGLFD